MRTQVTPLLALADDGGLATSSRQCQMAFLLRRARDLRCVCWPRNPLCVVEFGDGGLRTLLRNVAESFAATSMGSTSSPSSKPIATATLLDLEQSNHDCNPKSDSQSSGRHSWSCRTS